MPCLKNEETDQQMREFHRNALLQGNALGAPTPGGGQAPFNAGSRAPRPVQTNDRQALQTAASRHIVQNSHRFLALVSTLREPTPLETECRRLETIIRLAREWRMPPV